MDGLQNPGVGVTFGPRRDHVEGVVIVTRRRDECWKPRTWAHGKFKAVKKQPRWAREIVQQVRVLEALVEDLGSIPRQITTSVISFRVSGAFFWPLRHQKRTHIVLTYMQAEHSYI